MNRCIFQFREVNKYDDQDDDDDDFDFVQVVDDKLQNTKIQNEQSLQSPPDLVTKLY